MIVVIVVIVTAWPDARRYACERSSRHVLTPARPCAVTALEALNPEASIHTSRSTTLFLIAGALPSAGVPCLPQAHLGSPTLSRRDPHGMPYAEVTEVSACLDTCTARVAEGDFL